MYGKAYAIMNWNYIQEISLSRQNAEEILADYMFENGFEVFNYLLHRGYTPETAYAEAELEMAHWRIWEFDLV